MDDVRGRFLGLPHGTTPAAVTTNKNIKMSFFKSSENIQNKKSGQDRSVSDNQSSSVTLNELAMKARQDTVISTHHMSRVVRKPAFCICENKDSMVPLLSKYEISSF